MHLASALLAVTLLAGVDDKEQSRKPLHFTVDLNVGDSREVELPDGKKAKIKLLGVAETRDKVRSAIRQAHVKVEVNGETITLVAAYYRLPVIIAGVQIE